MNRDGLQRLILGQCGKYPQIQIEDIFKLLHQSEFGCGHMARDEAGSLRVIRKQAAALSGGALSSDVAEAIGEGLCRLHLRVLRQSTLTADTLNRFFVHTAGRRRGSAAGFEEKAAALRQLCEEGCLPFTPETVSQALRSYRAAGYPALRHSGRYREAYAPAYRVVDALFCAALPVFCEIDALRDRKARVTVAIDGGSGSGKTTLGALLKSVYACNVFTMDSFFLRPEQRTRERLAEPGGNIDRERFQKEVLEPLGAGKPFAYRPYDCSVGELSKQIFVNPRPLNIVEGAYSMHPSLSDAYDLKVFLKIGKEAQARRLQERNPNMYGRFVGEWIPMENTYFDTFQIPQGCDLTIRMAEPTI